MKKFLKKTALCLFFIFTLLSIVLLVSHLIVVGSTQGCTYNNVAEIPENRVGLVLGTAPYQKGGGKNPYFTYRIEATVRLYTEGKIQYVLISGDNARREYNEPEAFRRELVKRGIPKECIFLDYAGFRTLDSVVRAKAIFGQTSVTIISQKFHNERAIYIAQKNNINAIGYNAHDLPSHIGIKVQLREYFARIKMFIDLIFDIQPKFFGEKIVIE